MSAGGSVRDGGRDQRGGRDQLERLWRALPLRGTVPALGAWILGASTGVGRLSYSLYLWQQPFLARGHATARAWRDVPLALACATAAALVSYLVVERPTLALRTRWSRVPAGAGVSA